MIEFEGQITAALRNRVAPHHKRDVLLISGLLLLSAGIISFLFLPPPLDWQRHYFPVFVALIGGVFLTRALAKPAELPDLHVRGSISDQRISWLMQDHDAHEPWTSFSGATVAADYIVLQRSAFFGLVLAREFFRDAASWEEARAIVTRNVRVRPQLTPRRTIISLLIWIAIFAVVLVIARYFTRPA